ncbi:MAG: permease prefix domain 1-containing protein [bacterium]|nr:permease prefix domain 1-containing protein [bacterium]
MDAITTYIEQMFRALPHTGEVRRAKAELLAMSEDRYHELRAEGLSENEAVGRVITQFGNLDELADDLGIRTELDGVGDPAIALSASDAENYLRVSGRAATLVGSGIVAIMAGIVIRLLITEYALGLGLFFVFVAAGVGAFVTAGMMLSQYSQLEDRVLHLDGVTLAGYQRLRQQEQGTFTALIVGGIVTIILGAAANAVGWSLEESGALVDALRAGGLLGIGLGVFLLIRGGMRRTALDRLTSQDDPTSPTSADDSPIARWSSPYWILVVIIFLAWSFLTGDWGITWIVWPIAGLLYALLSAVLNAARPREDARR